MENESSTLSPRSDEFQDFSEVELKDNEKRATGADGSVVIASKPGLLSQHRPISSAVAGSIPAENHQGVLVGIAC